MINTYNGSLPISQFASLIVTKKIDKNSQRKFSGKFLSRVVGLFQVNPNQVLNSVEDHFRNRHLTCNIILSFFYIFISHSDLKSLTYFVSITIFLVPKKNFNSFNEFS